MHATPLETARNHRVRGRGDFPTRFHAAVPRPRGMISRPDFRAQARLGHTEQVVEVFAQRREVRRPFHPLELNPQPDMMTSRP